MIQRQPHQQVSSQGNVLADIPLKTPTHSTEDFSTKDGPPAACRQPHYPRVPSSTSCTRHGVPRHTLVICMLGELNNDGDWNMGNAVGGDSGCCLWALREGSSLHFSFISAFSFAYPTLDSHGKPQLAPPGVLSTDVPFPGQCSPHLVFILCPFPSEVLTRSFV